MGKNNINKHGLNAIRMVMFFLTLLLVGCTTLNKVNPTKVIPQPPNQNMLGMWSGAVGKWQTTIYLPSNGMGVICSGDGATNDSAPLYYNKGRLIEMLGGIVVPTSMAGGRIVFGRYTLEPDEFLKKATDYCRSILAESMSNNNLSISQSKHKEINEIKENNMASTKFLFQDEADKATRGLRCRNPKVTPSSHAWGALYSCIQGEAETVKWFINGVPHSSEVENIKLMWNDWHKDIGYGIHADEYEAEKAIDLMANIYAPGKNNILESMFFGRANKVMKTDTHKFIFTIRRGSKIDERLLVVTRKQTGDFY